MTRRETIPDFKSSGWLFGLALIISFLPFQVRAEPVPDVTKEMISSQHSIEKIGYYEFIKPLDTHLVFVRFITSYSDIEREFDSDGKTDVLHNKVATYMNGIYKMKEGKLYPVWEDTDNAGSYLIEESFSCMGECLAYSSFGTYYADFLDNTHPEFCITNTWSPYRGEYGMDICFDVDKPDTPILDIMAFGGNAIKKQKGNNLLVESWCNGKSEAGPDDCERCYSYNKNTNIYEPTPCQSELNLHDYNVKGEQLYREKQYQQALEYFLKAYKLDEDNEKTIGNLSVTLIKLERYDEAINYSQHMLDNARQLVNELNVLFNIGLAYEKSERYLDAIYWYDRIESSGTKSTMKDRIDRLAAKAMEKATSSTLQVFDASSDYPVAFEQAGVAYKVANDGAVVVLKFVQSRLRENVFDVLVIVTKRNNKVIPVVTWAEHHSVSNLDFKITDENMDGYPDISKVTYDGYLESLKTVKRQYWLYSPERHLLEGAFRREEITSSKKYEPITELNFNGVWGGKALPHGMERLIHLEKLNLPNRMLGGIPLVVTQLPQLKELECKWSELKTIPREIRHLQKLERLNLGNNTIESLPSEIFQLKSLKDLYLYHNKIKELPREIESLSQLEYLSLKGNKLKNIPLEIGRLRNLRSLDLGFNQIREMPQEISNLSQLRSLDLTGNLISDEEKKRIQNLVPFAKVIFKRDL